MRVKYMIGPAVSRAWQAVCAVRWRDPLVQVWGMVGGLLVVGIVTHYVRGRAGGEQKNPASAFGMVRLDGSELKDDWRPQVALDGGSDPAGDAPVLAVEPDLRAFAVKAAALPGWKHVSPDLRGELARFTQPVTRVEVKWSGTGGGNQAALDLYHTKTLGHQEGVPGDFIVGNGKRGEDGLIEPTRRWLTGSGEARKEITVCLVGTGPEPTAAQQSALGELITCIEARSGHVALAMHRPEHPGMLADAD